MAVGDRGDLADDRPRRVVERDHAECVGDEGDPDEQDREDDGDGGEGRGRVLRLGWLERRHAVGDRLGPGQGH